MRVSGHFRRLAFAICAAGLLSDEYHPTLSRDQRDLYFVRRGPDKGNFYRISTGAIEAFKQ